MASYLNIYLQRKKKEGEDGWERLLLCSISRANEIYSLFYDNSVGRMTENNYHEFTSDDINSLIIDIDEAISRTLSKICDMKEALPLISNKDAIADVMEDISSDRSYLRTLLDQKAAVTALCQLFDDIGEDWCDFDRIYWKIG